MTARPCRLAAALVLAASAAAVGCGGDDRPTPVPAGGKVMFRKTTPAAGALVVFHPTDPAFEKRIGGKPFAGVKEDGSFALTTYAGGDGAPEGEYGVTVVWQTAAREAKPALGGGEGGGGGGASRLGPKYGNPQQPFAKVTVKKGEPNDFSLDVD